MQKVLLKLFLDRLLLNWAIFFLFSLSTSINAGDIVLSFKGSGAGRDIDIIEIINLNSRASLIIAGSESLLLSNYTESQSKGDSIKNPVIQVFPNASEGSCKIESELFFPAFIKISINDSFGNDLLEFAGNIPRGSHKWEIKGLTKGSYQIIFQAGNFNYTHWIMSNSLTSDPNIKYIISENKSLTDRDQSLIPMKFTQGDRILFKATAGDFQRIIALSPEVDQTINFEFLLCSDADNNHYPIVQIGNQIWMAENLRTTKLKNGKEIKHIQNSLLWREINYASYTWYDHNENYQKPFGALYNWHAVEEDQLCPAGWRIPKDSDWHELENYIDPSINISSATGWRGKDGAYLLKSAKFWKISNKGNNYYGFSALPSGRRSFDGSFNSMGDYCYWWTLTAENEFEAWSRYIIPEFNYLYRGAYLKRYGFSVRCIKE